MIEQHQPNYEQGGELRWSRRDWQFLLHMWHPLCCCEAISNIIVYYFICAFVCFQKIKKPSKYIKKRTSRSKSVPIYSSSQQVMTETSFPPPRIPYLQRTISQESVRSVRNQDIFDKRATRKLSLLSLPTNLNYLEELEKTGHDMNANRKGSCRSISIHKSWLQRIIIYNYKLK